MSNEDILSRLRSGLNSLPQHSQSNDEGEAEQRQSTLKNHLAECVKNLKEIVSQTLQELTNLDGDSIKSGEISALEADYSEIITKFQEWHDKIPEDVNDKEEVEKLALELKSEIQKRIDEFQQKLDELQTRSRDLREAIENAKCESASENISLGDEMMSTSESTQSHSANTKSFDRLSEYESEQAEEQGKEIVQYLNDSKAKLANLVQAILKHKDNHDSLDSAEIIEESISTLESILATESPPATTDQNEQNDAFNSAIDGTIEEIQNANNCLENFQPSTSKSAGLFLQYYTLLAKITEKIKGLTSQSSKAYANLNDLESEIAANKDEYTEELERFEKESELLEKLARINDDSSTNTDEIALISQKITAFSYLNYQPIRIQGHDSYKNIKDIEREVNVTLTFADRMIESLNSRSEAIDKKRKKKETLAVLLETLKYFIENSLEHEQPNEEPSEVYKKLIERCEQTIQTLHKTIIREAETNSDLEGRSSPSETRRGYASPDLNGYLLCPESPTQPLIMPTKEMLKAEARLNQVRSHRVEYSTFNQTEKAEGGKGIYEIVGFCSLAFGFVAPVTTLVLIASKMIEFNITEESFRKWDTATNASVNGIFVASIICAAIGVTMLLIIYCGKDKKTPKYNNHYDSTEESHLSPPPPISDRIEFGSHPDEEDNSERSMRSSCAEDDTEAADIEEWAEEFIRSESPINSLGSPNNEHYTSALTSPSTTFEEAVGSQETLCNKMA